MSKGVCSDPWASNPIITPVLFAAGLYIYGSVGSGKSLIMQMFYDSVAQAKLVPLRRRMHFNAAMLEVVHRSCSS